MFLNRPDVVADPAGPSYSTLLCRERLLAMPFDAETGRRVSGLCNHEVTSFNGPANEVSLAVNPLDPMVVVAGAKDYSLVGAPLCGARNVWTGHYWSTDGGQTWGNGLIAGYPGGPEGPLSGNLCSTDPLVAFDAQGHAWYSGLAFRGAADPNEPYTGSGGLVSGSRVFIARSDDQGATWGQAGFAALGDNDNLINDKPGLAVDPVTGHLYVTWTGVASPGGVCPEAGCGRILFSESLDGALWSEPSALVGAGAPSPKDQFAMPVVARDGSVYVTWLHADDVDPTDASAARSTVFVARGVPQSVFAPGGLGGAAPATVFSPGIPAFVIGGAYFGGASGHGHRSHTIPVPAVDRSGGARDGCLYVAWAEEMEGDTEVRVASSCGDLLSWSDPVTVHSNPRDGTHQFLPWIDVGPDGAVHVAFYDNRHDPENRFVDLYYAVSLDGGKTWRDARVSEVSSDPSWSFHQNGATFLGDYVAVDASERAVHLAWTDTRHGVADIFHAVVLRSAADQQVFRDAAPTVAGPPPYLRDAR